MENEEGSLVNKRFVKGQFKSFLFYPFQLDKKGGKT